MADLPGPHAAIPHTPGAHHVPKWAWIAGGAGIVGAVALFHHRQAQAAAAAADATNAPGTAGAASGSVDSAVANPITGDPTVANGTTYPYSLPIGSAPIVIGDPLPATPEVAPDTPGTAQLPPISFPIQVGPINNQVDPQIPVTGGGGASGTGPRNPRPGAGHGASNIKDLHGGKASIAGKGPIRGGVKPHRQPSKHPPATGSTTKGPVTGPHTGPPDSIYRESGPTQVMQAPVSVAASAPATAITPKAEGAMAMPITGGGLPGTHAAPSLSPPPPMTPAVIIASVPAPPPPPKVATPLPLMAPPPSLAAPPHAASAAPPPPPPPMAPVTTQAAMSQSRVTAAAVREVAVSKAPSKPVVTPKPAPKPVAKATAKKR